MFNTWSAPHCAFCLYNVDASLVTVEFISTENVSSGEVVLCKICAAKLVHALDNPHAVNDGCVDCMTQNHFAGILFERGLYVG